MGKSSKIGKNALKILGPKMETVEQSNGVILLLIYMNYFAEGSKIIF